MNRLLKSMVCCLRPPSVNIVEVKIPEKSISKKIAIGDDIEDIGYIASGFNGDVNQVKVDNKLYTCKRFKNRNIYNQEKRIMKQLKQSKRLQRYAFCDDDKLCLYSHYIEGMDMYYFLEENSTKNSFPTFNDNVVGKIGKQILLGLKELQNQGYVHLDLKPENLIIDDDLNVVLIDFDTSRLLYKNKNLNYLLKMVGTENYMAPEIKKKKFNETTDIWSLGVILWILRIGAFPYEYSYLFKKKLTEYAYYEYAEDNPVFLDLMKKMFVKNPYERITIKKALKHDYFKNI
tara:strand:- start:1260 stop:2126 length:867 start_codon:yes stop_codon:yes gene_type:complete